MKKVVVLTGAGISADSGLSTFRDSGGLWEGYNIEEVATIDAWYSNRELLLDFYNIRRKQSAEAKPNAAHYAVADLEEKFDVTVVTQNVDSLHERAGSTNVVHLHGRLDEARSENDPDIVINIGGDPIKAGDKASDGTQLRPNIVWFGEPVPMIERGAEAVSRADLFIVVGTSLVVYPAASLVDYAPRGIDQYIVDPARPELFSFNNWTHIQKRAAEGMPELTEKLLKQFNE
ncbi:MAG: NAD-dependent deacylase [Balneolaceae bacterium]|nr:NAD-dependent deacylase [Balneolaceae bacterium]